MSPTATAWEAIEDPAVLGEVLDGIALLAEILERERTAVAALDPVRLAELAERKGPLVDLLRRLAETRSPSRPAPMAERSLREHVRAASVRLLAQAEANAALLNDAIHALSEALGIEQEAGTYDAHARLGRRVRAFAGRRV